MRCVIYIRSPPCKQTKQRWANIATKERNKFIMKISSKFRNMGITPKSSFFRRNYSSFFLFLFHRSFERKKNITTVSEFWSSKMEPVYLKLFSSENIFSNRIINRQHVFCFLQYLYKVVTWTKINTRSLKNWFLFLTTFLYIIFVIIIVYFDKFTLETMRNYSIYQQRNRILPRSTKDQPPLSSKNLGIHLYPNPGIPAPPISLYLGRLANYRTHDLPTDQDDTIQCTRTR